jgi:predicted amidohydrolase
MQIPLDPAQLRRTRIDGVRPRPGQVRMLSSTKVSYGHTPGTSPIAIDIEGVRSGCTLGMESAYPELILDYEQAAVHCVLLPTQGPGASFALQALGHASSSSNWTGYAT